MKIKKHLLLGRKVMTNMLLLLLLSHSVVSDSVRPHRWDSPAKNTGVGSHFLLQCIKVKSESDVAQSCLTLRHPVDCSLPGSSVHGIFQARVLEWGAIAFSEDQHRQHIKKQRHYFANKGPSSQGFF